MAAATYPGFNIEIDSFPTCGEVTIVDNSTWPTPNLWPPGTPLFPFARTDVKLILFYRDDNGILHWDVTDPNPGTWTITGYTVDGQKEVYVYAVPVARPVPPGTPSPAVDNGFFAGQVAFDASDGNYYVITANISAPMTNNLHTYVGSVLKLDDTVLSVDQIFGYFSSCWSQINTPLWARYYYLWAYSNPAVYIYCLSRDLNLSYNVINNCQSITLDNMTPLVLVDQGSIWPQIWANFATAVFVVDSNGALVYSGAIPNSLNYPYDITFPIPGDGIYNIYVFVDEQYLPYLSYSTDDIVFYNGEFCIVDGLGNFNPIPLTLVGLSTFQDHWNSGGGWSGNFYTQAFVNCNPDAATFTTLVENNCEQIRVTDGTPWPVNLGAIQREYCGIALWYSYNGAIYNDFSNMGTNSTPGEWIIPITGNGIYNISMFVVPIWTTGSWATNEIVFNNGNFYIATAPHLPGGIAPSIDPTGWRLLDNTDYFTFYNNWDGPSADRFYAFIQRQVNVTCFNTEPVTSPSNIYQIACHSFRVDYSSLPTTLNIAISVWNLDMTERISCLIIPAGSTDTYADVTTPTDGVYIIEYGYQLDQTSTNCDINYEEMFVQYPVYDFCNALVCYNALVQILLCNELDPCCRNCDPDFIEKRKIYREELNKMMALMFQLYALLNIEQLDFVGYNIIYQQISQNVYEPFSIDRNLILDRIQDVIEKLSEITGRCGDCDGPRENLSNKPCTNCGGQSNV